jgi:hypothetical protein
MYGAAVPPGIFHIEELFALDLSENHLSLRLAEVAEDSKSFTIDGITCWSHETNG